MGVGCCTLIAPNNTNFFATHSPASFVTREIGGMMTLAMLLGQGKWQQVFCGCEQDELVTSQEGGRRVMAADIQR